MSDVQGYFRRVATEWDVLRRGYFTEAVRKAAIQRAGLAPGMAVADIGCGTGYLAEALAPRVARVYAVDASPEMLAVAERNLAAFANVTYLVAAGDQIPLPAGSLDAVLANMYLHHCPDPALAIREMARLLRPGGVLVVSDMEKHEHEWMREEMADLWLGFERGDVERWCRDAGLGEVEVGDSGET